MNYDNARGAQEDAGYRNILPSFSENDLHLLMKLCLSSGMDEAWIKHG